MKWFLAALLGLALAVSSATAAEKTVIEIVDNKPVTVKAGAHVRLRVTGIAGTTMEAKVTGDAKLTETHIVPQVGKQPVIGSHVMEYTVVTEKAGKVTLEVTTKSPTEKEPKKVTIEITVE